MRGRNKNEPDDLLPVGAETRSSGSRVTNYYGEAFLSEVSGRFFLCLHDHCDGSSREVSEKFARAWFAEFGDQS